MRLRYLHLKNYPPIQDLAVRFASGSPLDRECAIRFVAGVNGSGKSNLLRAVAEVFLALADGRLPPFPVSLVYELGTAGSSSHRTLLLDCPGKRDESSLWLHERFRFDDSNGPEVFSVAVEHLRAKGMPSVPGFVPLIKPGDWPTRAVNPPQIALPNAVLAYTSGDPLPWRSIWNRNQAKEGLIESQVEEGDGDNNERPAGWTASQEAALTARETRDEAVPSEAASGIDSPGDGELFRRPILINPTLLKCALLAVVLPSAIGETADDPTRKNPFQELLERGGWDHLVSVGFRCQLQASTWRQNVVETAHDWLLYANEVIAEPHPREARRVLYFDLKATLSNQGFRTLIPNEGLNSITTHGEALWALLGGHEGGFFEIFSRLLELHQGGLFDDVEIRLRRADKPEHAAGPTARNRDAGVLRYEEMSDGEQMFLGRMALLYLLRDQHDSLLLLDEPETHFNDLWKRDIVSIVDEALAHTSAEVMIATHAALVLTDALRDELLVLERLSEGKDQALAGTTVRVLGSDTHTFGATGDHPLRDIFGAPDTVGRRASRLLEVLIAAASLAEEMDAYWANGDEPHPDLIAKVLAIAAETEQGLTERSVADDLHSIGSFAEHFGANRPLRMKAVLEAFIQQTGPGYFQVELKRAWRRLLERAPHAA